MQKKLRSGSSESITTFVPQILGLKIRDITDVFLKEDCGRQ